MSRYHFQISAHMLHWPKACACCGHEAETQLRASASKSTRKQVGTETPSWWDVPYCSGCIEHIKQHRKAKRTLIGGILVAAIVVLLVGDYFNSVPAGLLGAILPMLAFIKASQDMHEVAAEMQRPECHCLGPAVEYQGWYGTSHDFVFSNPAYLESFLQSNHQKTISDVTEVA